MGLADPQHQRSAGAAPQRPQPQTQQSTRFLFLDLDPLLTAVKAHVQAQSTVFHEELAQFSKEGIILHPQRLTALLDGQQQQSVSVDCRRGSYFNPSQENARMLQGVGWDLKKKGAPEHRTLENLLERNLEHVGVCGPWGSSKTLVLATGMLMPPTQSSVQAYLDSGWRVQLFCLRRCWKVGLDELTSGSLGRFEVVFMDKFLKRLLTGKAPTCASTGTCGSSSLLSRMAANYSVFSQVSAHRSSVHSAAHNRAQALAAAPSPGGSSFNWRSASSGAEFPMERESPEKVMTREQDAVQRRQSLLLTLPQVYSPGHRQRYVFMNLDNIAGALFTSQTLFRRIEGATGPRDIRLDFEGLTDRLCGRDASTLVQRQVATYCKTSPHLARALTGFGWRLKPPSSAGSDAKALHYELMSQLATGATTANEKTLVLAMGDGALGGPVHDKTAYRETICKFVEQHWCVEVHAWLHALNDGFLALQREFPGRVVVKPLDDGVRDLVYLKKREDQPNLLPPAPAPAAQRAGAPASNLAFVPARADSGRSQGAIQSHREAERVALPTNGSATSRQSPTSPLAPSVAALFASIPTVATAPPLPSLPPVVPPLASQSLVSVLQQQMQQIQETFAALQMDASARNLLQQQNELLAQRVHEQERAFELERARQAALSAQLASDARLARRLALEEREESLTCPITQDLYEEPATTVCCGKTFSGGSLARLRELGANCPWCREPHFSTHPNRDVADLVAQYRSEQAALEAEEATAQGT